MIEAKNLTKKYGDHKVVDDLSFKAEKGKTTILLGTSGCGKTTTLKMINGLINPDSGEVLINSISNSGVLDYQLRRGIGYVLQDTGLFPHITVGENIALVPKLLGWKKDKIFENTTRLMSHFGLDPNRYYSSKPADLSGGQKQRVGLARALIASPPIILMDEPFGALDPITRNSIRQDFKNLPELKEKCIIMVTHDIGEAFDLGDQIILLDQGKIQQIGIKNDFLYKPRNAFVKKFLQNHFLYLQTKVRNLDTFFDQFLTEIPNGGIVIGEVQTDQTFDEALRFFATNQELEILEINHSNGNKRFTHFKQLMILLSADLP